MSATDETEYPWLINEKKYIRSAIEAGKPVLGICLGAQLIANSVGGKVFQNSVKEIGWFPVEAVESESTPAFQFPQEIEVFHWHGKTFSLPKGAVQIAKSKGCENQAFQIGSNAIGLQFHLETTPLSARAIVENCRNELVEGKYIQSEAEILSAPQERYSLINITSWGKFLSTYMLAMANNRIHADSKKRRSFLTLLFTAGVAWRVCRAWP